MEGNKLDKHVSILDNYLRDTACKETHCGCCFIAIILTGKHLHVRLSHQNKNDWLLLNGPFFRNTLETKFHFISLAKKNKLNIIFIYGGVKISFGVVFISGLM